VERTLIILKPDALTLKIQDELLDSLVQAGLCCLTRKTLHLTRELILKWRENWDSYDDWFWKHVDFMTSAPVEIWLVSGPQAVAATLGVKSIFRNKYASSRIKNILHCPDCAEEATHEIDLFINGRG